MDHVTLRKQVKTHDDQGNASKSTVTEQKENLSDIWNPAFNEFQFGDSPADVNSHLPNPFDSSKWEDLPQAHENKEDVVKYFWLPLSRFGDKITKFIPPNTTVNEQSYICFLFIHQKLYFISIRLFHDDTHQNYNDIVEAYANAVNTPVIETGHGKEFFYTDDSIIYVAHFHDDKSHILIEVLQKGHSKSDDNTFRQLSLDRERKLSPAQPFIPSQAHKYDIMISYCHRDKELSHRIYYRLLEDKFRVWMDVENMYGPIVERMAESIENSEFVLLLMSNAYKSSSYCQLEAEYAFKYQACLIPLVVKNDFTQTGWLGMLVGLRHHIDFTKTTFDDAYAQLCKELQHFRTQSIEKSQPLKSTE
ncbi:unnamed protein product [Adineta steineri]|uniref:TIR domain-containing protein n=1 Tax=Adineta steineri TaxID=433720 RepID=A0A814KUY4_9BILA|nr:unnamed protein product [Adineta steineri]